MLRTDAAPPLLEQEPVSVAKDGAAEIIDFAWVFLRRQYPIIPFLRSARRFNWGNLPAPNASPIHRTYLFDCRRAKRAIFPATIDSSTRTDRYGLDRESS